MSNQDETISIDPSDIRSPNDGWYYTVDSVRYGPVPDSKMRDFVKTDNYFDVTTRVWRKGMMEWSKIQDTELSSLLPTSSPPPLPPHMINNMVVWLIALMPLAFGIIDASITRSNLIAGIIGPASQPSMLMWIWIPATVNAALCVWDAILLNRAGYNSKLLGAGIVGFLLVPAYLYRRDQVAQQRQVRILVWIGMIVLASFIYSSSIS